MEENPLFREGHLDPGDDNHDLLNEIRDLGLEVKEMSDRLNQLWRDTYAKFFTEEGKKG